MSEDRKLVVGPTEEERKEARMWPEEPEEEDIQRKRLQKEDGKCICNKIGEARVYGRNIDF